MTEDDVRHLLRLMAARRAKRAGSSGLTAWCAEKGIACSHASEFLNGKRCPSSDLLAAMNLERAYAPKAPPK